MWPRITYVCFNSTIFPQHWNKTSRAARPAITLRHMSRLSCSQENAFNIYTIFFWGKFEALEEGTDSLSRNVDNYHYLLRCSPEERSSLIFLPYLSTQDNLINIIIILYSVDLHHVMILGIWPTWCTNFFCVFISIYNSLHVSNTQCSSSGKTNCINTASGNSHSMLVAEMCAPT